MKINQKNKKIKIHGFTLIEVLFSLSIVVVVSVALTLFARNMWINNSFISNGLQDIDMVRSALKIMTAEIRTAGPADTGAYVVNQVSASAFILYSDIDNDGLRERVRYFLDTGSLKKGVTKPTGSPLAYNLANEVVTTIVPYVTNANIFSFYDENYDGTSAALTFPVNIPAIRLVKVTITMDKDPNRPPSPITMTTQVSIRNLKDNL
jgi:prepilin-type N-terminal cleavage/methylation domain-containing protein